MTVAGKIAFAIAPIPLAGKLNVIMTMLEWLEALSYLVTIVGFPFAIYVFLKEQRKERQNDDEELYLQLSDEYAKFLQLVLNNADLQLITRRSVPGLTPEQRERRNVIFEILIALFERAYLLVYEEEMSPKTARMWQSWDDYMREWCCRPDFRELLPGLLQGEDLDFGRHILKISEEEAAASAKASNDDRIAECGLRNAASQTSPNDAAQSPPAS